MKATSLLSAMLIPLLLASCLFKEPVFTEGFAKTDDSITGVWVMEEEKADLAACFKVDDSHYVMHYPAREKDGIYYSMQQIKVRDRDLLQVRALGTLKNRPVRPGDKEVYTLIWIEKLAAGKLNVRPLNGKMEKTPPAELRKMIENPGSDWNEFFVEAKVFKRTAKD